MGCSLTDITVAKVLMFLLGLHAGILCPTCVIFSLAVNILELTASHVSPAALHAFVALSSIKILTPSFRTAFSLLPGSGLPECKRVYPSACHTSQPNHLVSCTAPIDTLWHLNSSTKRSNFRSTVFGFCKASFGLFDFYICAHLQHFLPMISHSESQSSNFKTFSIRDLTFFLVIFSCKKKTRFASSS